MNKKEIHLLFTGDSITDGNRYKDPDKEWDLNHQIGHSFVYVINALLGSLYPEKNTVLALALVCGMQWQDVLNLLAVCGFEFRGDEVRDIVVRYLIENSIFNPVMRDACLAEYRIENLPIA